MHLGATAQLKAICCPMSLAGVGRSRMAVGVATVVVGDGGGEGRLDQTRRLRYRDPREQVALDPLLFAQSGGELPERLAVPADGMRGLALRLQAGEVLVDQGLNVHREPPRT